MKKNIFISPHLDDAVVSCGEYIKKLKNHKEDILVITVFTGAPSAELLSAVAKQFHGAWGLGDDAVLARKKEDEAAMKLLNVDYIYLDEHECLYRIDRQGKSKYNQISEIHTNDFSKDMDTIERLNSRLVEIFDKLEVGKVFVPLGIGRHIDHIVSRKCIEDIAENRPLEIFYYEEIPYVCTGQDAGWKVDLTKGLVCSIVNITDEEWLHKVEGINCYKSQLGIMWGCEEKQMNQLNEASQKYSKDCRSIRFWGRNPL